MPEYRVVDHPELQPGVDYLTKSGVGPFVDTGVDIKYLERKLGRIYLSEATIRELAEKIGITNTATEAQLAKAYHQGKIDALKEGLGNDLVRVADALLRSGVALAPDRSGAADAEGGEQAAA